MRNTLFGILFLVITANLYSQNIQIPSFALSEVSFKVKIQDIPDSLESFILTFQSDEEKIESTFKVINGMVDSAYILHAAGNYKIESDELGISAEIRIIPGWLSIVPPLLAIFLALVIRQVVTALAAGIYAGAFFIYDYDPFAALLRLADTFMIDSLIDKDHMFIIVFTLLIGGVVGVISKNGGTAGLAQLITKYAKTSRSGMISSWLMGVVVFFDDYANSLIIGNMMRPITDRLRVSREKLAYIVDSTAAPIASIVLISTWIGYEVGLIEDGLRAVGSEANAYDVFIRTIPYSFYPIAAIVFVFLTSYLRRDFGAMYKAEIRARETGEVAKNNLEVKGIKDDSEVINENVPARWFNGAIPIMVILFGTVIGLYFTGVNSLEDQGIHVYGLQEIINSSDSYSALLWSSFIACIVAIVMSISQRLLTLNESLEAWQKGVQSMMIAVIILVFAWAISSVTHQLYTADYLMSIISDSMDPRFLPALVFIVCALTGFSTGTSWGTMAIVMPIVIPLTHKLSMSFGLPAADYNIILYGVISSVLAGSVFGDHCSPIADTTILSSLASKCNHIDHVNTQLPYAILVGFVCMVLGYIPSAFGLSPFISIGLIITTLISLLLLIGKKVPDAKAG